MDFYTVNLVDLEVGCRNKSEFLNEKFNHTAGAVVAFKPQNICAERQVFFDLNIAKFFNLETSDADSKFNGKRYFRLTLPIIREIRKNIEYPYLTDQKKAKMVIALEILFELAEGI